MLKDGKPTPEDTVELEGHPIKELCVIGKTVDREKASLRQDLILDDTTESIRAIFYQKEQDTDPRAFKDYSYESGSYVKVYGTYRLFKDEVVIVGHHIQKLADHNEITNHLLRAFTSQQARTKGPLAVEQLGASKPAQRENSMNESQIEEIVLSEIKKLVNRESLEFVDVRNVFPLVRRQLKQDQFDACVSSLEQKGTLYSTGDDHVYGFICD